MKRSFYSDTIANFIASSFNEIFGALSINSDFPDDPAQKGAWTQEITTLKRSSTKLSRQNLFRIFYPSHGKKDRRSADH